MLQNRQSTVSQLKSIESNWTLSLRENLTSIYILRQNNVNLPEVKTTSDDFIESKPSIAKGKTPMNLTAFPLWFPLMKLELPGSDLILRTIEPNYMVPQFQTYPQQRSIWTTTPFRVGLPESLFSAKTHRISLSTRQVSFWMSITLPLLAYLAGWTLYYEIHVCIHVYIYPPQN